ncbi:MAG: DUF4837 family protein [Bacteroidales bacterium]|nr:DUF4837 family protein [Bacteroidales bacterium]
MINRWLISLIPVSWLFFISCSTSLTSNLPSVTGRANEVVIVADLSVWDSPVGDTIRYVFEEPVPALPQYEPYFSILHKDPSGFRNSNMYKNHRNLCLISMADTLENKVVFREDVFSTPQLVMDVTASSPDSLIALMLRNKKSILQIFRQKELKRNISIHNRTLHQEIHTALKKDHFVSLTIPRGWNLDVNKKDFAWVSMDIDRENVQLGILVWHYPYTDEKQFSRQELLRTMNSVMKKNVPGPEEGTYMVTDTVNYETIYEPISYNNQYYVWMKGLWYIENYFMGGPYVALSTINEKAGQIITVEAFVYAPQKEKRNYLRQLESIVSSLSVDELAGKVDSVSFVPDAL